MTTPRPAVARGNGERPAVYARFLRTSYPRLADHEIADAWRSATAAEAAYWRELGALAGDGTLRARITRLAETWEGHPELTEQGQVLRDLGQVLRDELHHASDAAPEPHAADGLAEVLSSPAELARWVEVNHGDHLEWVDELRALLPALEQPAPELAKLRELLDEIGVMAANAPEDGDSFGLLEEIAMRIAAAGVPDSTPLDGKLP